MSANQSAIERKITNPSLKDFERAVQGTSYEGHAQETMEYANRVIEQYNATYGPDTLKGVEIIEMEDGRFVVSFVGAENIPADRPLPLNEKGEKQFPVGGAGALLSGAMDIQMPDPQEVISEQNISMVIANGHKKLFMPETEAEKLEPDAVSDKRRDEIANYERTVEGKLPIKPNGYTYPGGSSNPDEHIVSEAFLGEFLEEMLNYEEETRNGMGYEQKLAEVSKFVKPGSIKMEGLYFDLEQPLGKHMKKHGEFHIHLDHTLTAEVSPRQMQSFIHRDADLRDLRQMVREKKEHGESYETELAELKENAGITFFHPAHPLPLRQGEYFDFLKEVHGAERFQEGGDLHVYKEARDKNPFVYPTQQYGMVTATQKMEQSQPALNDIAFKDVPQEYVSYWTACHLPELQRDGALQAGERLQVQLSEKHLEAIHEAYHDRSLGEEQGKPPAEIDTVLENERINAPSREYYRNCVTC